MEFSKLIERRVHMYCQNESDETLVMLTLAGEQTAYEVLVVRYQKTVIASAIAVTKNHFMAEDAAQDAFVTAGVRPTARRLGIINP